MAEAMDIVGYAVLNPGAAAVDPGFQSYLPLLRGSRYTKNPALEVEDVAMGLPESPVWTQGVTMPALLARVPVFVGTNGWLTAKRLSLALLPDTTAAGATPWVGAGFTGLIQNSWGPLQYALADAGDGAPVLWNNSKVASMRFDWNGQDAVICTMLLMLYGGTSTAVLQTALDSALTPAQQRPTGPYVMSQGVTYNGGATGVISGSLSFVTNLRPDLTTPLGTAPDQHGVSYPNNYWNDGPPKATLSLTQKKGTASIVGTEGSDDAVNTAVIQFNGIGASPAHVAATLKILNPAQDKPTNIQLARITRTYNNVKPDGTGSAFSIAFA